MEVLLVALSSLCAMVPMLSFLGLVWWLDRYDREPVWLVVLTFLWGAIGSVLLALVGSVVVQMALGALLQAVGQAMELDLSELIAASGAVIVAPLCEEPAKALFLLFVIWNRHFDNMTDGFVYGAAAGLGFGMTENFMYFAMTSGDVSAWGQTVIIRTFYSAVMHATATAIVGAGLGWARFRGIPLMVMSGTLGLILAMLVHGLWNGLLTLDEFGGGQGNLFQVNLVLFPLEVLMTFVVFQLCLLEESITLRRELGEEAKNGVIPADHPKKLASYIARFGSHWLPAGIDQDRYVETATNLAMRKKQLRQMGDRAPAFYRDDVARLRAQLQKMLAQAG